MRLKDEDPGGPEPFVDGPTATPKSLSEKGQARLVVSIKSRAISLPNASHSPLRAPGSGMIPGAVYTEPNTDATLG